MTTLFSIIESPNHPKASDLYSRLGIRETKFSGMRKAISAVKKEHPDFIVAEFFYGYGNNYAGVNVSNLDTLLATLQRYSPDSKVIVAVSKEEAQYVDKLKALFPVHGVAQHPVRPADLARFLESGN